MTPVPGSIRCKSTPTSRHSDRTLDAAASPVPMHAAFCREAARKRQPTATTRRGRVPQLSKCPRRTAPPLRTTARLRHQSRHHSHQAMSSDSDGDEVDAFSAVLRKFLPGGLGEPTEAVTTPTSARAARPFDAAAPATPSTATASDATQYPHHPTQHQHHTNPRRSFNNTSATKHTKPSTTKDGYQTDRTTPSHHTSASHSPHYNTSANTPTTTMRHGQLTSATKAEGNSG